MIGDSDRERLLDAIRSCMVSLPNLRLGQVIENAMYHRFEEASHGGMLLFYISDKVLADVLFDYIQWNFEESED